VSVFMSGNSVHFSFLKHHIRGGGVVQVVEHLPAKRKVQYPQPPKNNVKSSALHTDCKKKKNQ
jgi:hypothetical protein